MSGISVVICTCGAQRPHWADHRNDCAMKLAGLLSEERAKLSALKQAVRKLRNWHDLDSVKALIAEEEHGWCGDDPRGEKNES